MRYMSSQPRTTFFKVSRTNKYNSTRRKNPRPKRAVNNARTVLKVRRDKEEEVEEEEEPNLVLCLRISMRRMISRQSSSDTKEETTLIKKGAKRMRTQRECDVCEKRFTSGNLKPTRVFTRTRNRSNVMCAKFSYIWSIERPRRRYHH